MRYFAAAFYRVFGDRPWILLVAQVLLNAAVPWLVYRLALEWTNQRTALVAAAITGLFSFNTLYASTQSSDAVCTVIFMSAIVVFGAARRQDRWPAFALVGLLTGLAPQFRPNLILVPLVLVAYAVFERRTRPRLKGLYRAADVRRRNPRPLGLAQLQAYGHRAADQHSWRRAVVVRHAPSRTLPAQQSVQSPLGLRSACFRLHQPRPRADCRGSGIPLHGTAAWRCVTAYWSDADSVEKRAAPTRVGARRYAFQIPAPGRDAVVYYYFVTTWSEPSGPARRANPDGWSARVPSSTSSATTIWAISMPTVIVSMCSTSFA
jgi:hypothetical protein